MKCITISHQSDQDATTTIWSVLVAELPSPSLPFLQEKVDGNVEVAACTLGGVPVDIWCNEEALCRTDLPVNQIASALADRILLGDVVLTAGPDDDGSTRGFTEAEMPAVARAVVESFQATAAQVEALVR